MATTTTNYLQNKTLLMTIAKSKDTYCWYKEPHHNKYNHIVDEPTLKEAFAKIERIMSKSREQYLAETGEQMDATQIIFRVMTNDHIPPEALEVKGRRRRTVAARKLEEDYDEDDDNDDDSVEAGLNFPAFQHYCYNSNGKLECVGRSHWLDGKFSSTHGRVDNDLARAWLQLVQRFSTKWNYRGYSYIDEMRANALIQLTQVGLKFNEAKSDNPFAYLTAIVNNAFVRQLKKEKIQGDIKNELREYAGLNGSFDRQGGTNEVSER